MHFIEKIGVSLDTLLLPICCVVYDELGRNDQQYYDKRIAVITTPCTAVVFYSDTDTAALRGCEITEAEAHDCIINRQP